MQGDATLEDRFREHLAGLGLARPGTRVLVALSGGCDSVALLHLLRFRAAELGVEVRAAHLDHAMRAGSAADARWVEGLCRGWEVPLAAERAGDPPRSEEEARRVRYAFLHRAAAAAGCTHLATAHHADDQAETVLFRALRGTGIRGLAGIPPTGPRGLVRPLLPFWREEIRRYARRARLRWREDPTNRDPGPARNRIRRDLLPLAERAVAPGARRNLVRLAELAREEEEAWRALVAPLERAAARREGDSLVLAREILGGYDSAVASRILRNLLRQFGVVLDRTGTRMALQFISEAPSGREMRLPGSLRLTTEFDSARIERVGDPSPPDEPLSVPAAVPRGAGKARIGGRAYRVSWTSGEGEEGASGGETVALARDAARFPLTVRGWRPGDRIRTPGGTKTLKKLFGERRVPRSGRHALPVVVDAEGAVLWVWTVQAASGLTPRAGQTALLISIVHD